MNNKCECYDCSNNEMPCEGDCDYGEECVGCYENRLNADENEYEIKSAIGWR